MKYPTTMKTKTGQNEQTDFHIKPELPIGTEFWFMYQNTPTHGVIAEILVSITSCVDRNISWWEQIYHRVHNKTAKKVWEYQYGYGCKTRVDYTRWQLTKKNDTWYLVDRQIFFTKDELTRSL